MNVVPIEKVVLALAARVDGGQEVSRAVEDTAAEFGIVPEAVTDGLVHEATSRSSNVRRAYDAMRAD